MPPTMPTSAAFWKEAAERLGRPGPDAPPRAMPEARDEAKVPWTVACACRRRRTRGRSLQGPQRRPLPLPPSQRPGTPRRRPDRRHAGRPLAQPIGQEGDGVSTIAKFLVEPLRSAEPSPPRIPPASPLLAESYADPKRLAFGWDYFQRPVPLGNAPPIPVAAEMIYWERPGGGRVFHAGSINAGSTLVQDPKWAGLM